MSATARSPAKPRAATAARLPGWWPLAALTLLAAALRLSTLDLQSFWYDEAFTPVHVLHSSLTATLRSVAHTENTPPLWYVIAWADSRVLGTGEVALRLPSALAGIATVPVAWAIARELASRRAAIACAALVAVNPLFVWYSQEARAYGLFVLTAALTMLCFLRAEREPTRWHMAAFALSGVLALLSHYFAVFLLIPMILWLMTHPRLRRAGAAAVAALVLVGLALLPLISTQGGHGTQWIGRWPLSERLQAIPQYFLTGTSGEPLGHGIELLVALPILAGVALGLWRIFDRPVNARRSGAGEASDPGDASPAADASSPSDASDPSREERGALIAALIAACGVLIPVVLVAFGADYLAPRNLVAAMIPLTALIAVLTTTPAAGRAGVALLAVSAVAFIAITIDVDLSPRLQRGDWRGVAQTLRGGSPALAITTVQLGAAPLEYYLPGLHNLRPGSSAQLAEIVETGYSPLRASAGRPPAAGFGPLGRRNIHGLIVYRFTAPSPRPVSEATLARHVITLVHPEVLIAAGVRGTR
jgi:mannosyltransferase